MAKLTVQLPPASELPRLRRALFAWHRRHGLRAPWRSSGDPYQVLVAAVMAQQTQMSRVLPKFDAFIAAFPTVEALRCSLLEVKERYNRQWIVERHGYQTLHHVLQVKLAALEDAA